MASHVVAEHDDDIRIKSVGALDDRLDMIRRHPGIAGVNIGDGGDLQLKTRRPLRRRQVIARHVEPQQRLDAETIGRRRGAEGAETGQEAKEFAACDHQDRKW